MIPIQYAGLQEQRSIVSDDCDSRESDACSNLISTGIMADPADTQNPGNKARRIRVTRRDDDQVINRLRIRGIQSDSDWTEEPIIRSPERPVATIKGNGWMSLLASGTLPR